MLELKSFINPNNIIHLHGVLGFLRCANCGKRVKPVTTNDLMVLKKSFPLYDHVCHNNSRKITSKHYLIPDIYYYDDFISCTSWEVNDFQFNV